MKDDNHWNAFEKSKQKYVKFIVGASMIFDTLSVKEATVDMINIDNLEHMEEVKKNLYEGYLDEEIRRKIKNKLDNSFNEM